MKDKNITEGKDIKIWLIENDMSQKQLAEKLGYDDRTISLYCTTNGPKWMKYALGIESIIDGSK